MILRRLSQSLKDQNWTAIWIEFVLLVAGVFLGIQVSNWNAARADNARAQAYVGRIDANLQTDLQSIERREVFWPKVIVYGKAAIHYAETGEHVDGSAWKTVLAFYQASQLWQWSATDTTYQEMRSAGELGLIRDEQLRDALAQYYLETGPGVDYLFKLQPKYREIVRGLTPSVAADYIWAKCWRQPEVGEQYLIDCDSPITEAEAQAILEGYLKDPNLLTELRFWVANQGVTLSASANFKRSLNAMLVRRQAQEAP
ncbi:MAG: hypothetical protein NT117_01650 [Gammaproteobacteria bacterium]|nr:hypothetical protein [Gammaproteobacteria bacterium]